MVDEPIRLRLTARMRLRSPRDFGRVFKRGKRSSDGNITVIAVPNGAHRPRLGLAIPRRHVKRAVARNRIKRIVRESFRANQALLDGLDVVVLARPGAGTRSGGHLRHDLERHWHMVVQRVRHPAPDSEPS